MKLNLTFTQIQDGASCTIFFNKTQVYTGEVLPNLILTTEEVGDITIEIETKNNLIFEFKKAIIDDQCLDDIMWDHGFFIDPHGNIQEGCLYACKPGIITLKISNPILPWLLENKHKKFNNDPNWEDDYLYYNKACQLLNLIKS